MFYAKVVLRPQGRPPEIALIFGVAYGLPRSVKRDWVPALRAGLLNCQAARMNVFGM